MFGIGKKKEENPQQALARQMRERSNLMRQGASLDQNAMKAAEDGRRRGMRVVLGGFVAVTALLAGQMAAMAITNLPYRLPFGASLNTLLFSPPSAPEGNYAGLFVPALAQAVFLCLAAAVLPLCTHVWVRLRDTARGNLYISFWGVTVTLPFLFFFIRDFFWPLLTDVLDIFV